MIETTKRSVKALLKDEGQKEKRRISQKSDKGEPLKQQGGEVEIAVRQESPESLAEFKKRFVVPRPQQAVEIIEKIQADGEVDRDEREELNDIVARAARKGGKKTAAQHFLESYAKKVNRSFELSRQLNTSDLSYRKWFALKCGRSKKVANEVEPSTIKAFKPRRVYDRPGMLFRSWIDGSWIEGSKLDTSWIDEESGLPHPHVKPELTLSARETIKALNQQIKEGGASLQSLMIEASSCTEPMAIAAAFSLMLKHGESEEDLNILRYYLVCNKTNSCPELLREAFMLAAPELKLRPIPFLAGLRSFSRILGLEEEGSAEAKNGAPAEDAPVLSSVPDLNRLLVEAMMEREPPSSEEEAERTLNALGLFGENERCQQFALSMIKKGWGVKAALRMLAEKDNGRPKQLEENIASRAQASLKKLIASGGDAKKVLEAVSSELHRLGKEQIALFQDFVDAEVDLNFMLDFESSMWSAFEGVDFDYWNDTTREFSKMIAATGAWFVERLSDSTLESEYAEKIVTRMLRRCQRQQDAGGFLWQQQQRKMLPNLCRAIQLAEERGVPQERLRDLLEVELPDRVYKDRAFKAAVREELASQEPVPEVSRPSLRELLQNQG